MTSIDLTKYGIRNVKNVLHNPSYEELFQAEVSEKNEGYEKGILTKTGAVCVKTGIFTGRSPKDKYIVKDATSDQHMWWDGNINQPVTPEIYNECKALVQKQMSDKETIYVMDAFCGTNEDTRLKVRFIMEVAWQAHFVKNMFIRPSRYELEHFGEPDFVFINGSKVTNPKWKEQGLHSDVFVMFNLTERIAICGGT